MSFLERVDQTIRRSPVWRSLFRQPYPRRRAVARVRGHEQRVPAHPPGARPPARGQVRLHVLPRRAVVLPVPGADRDRRVPDVLLRPVGDARRTRTSSTSRAEVTFGLLTRNIHRWAAHLMVFFVFLHMMRVFYHGAYKPPREFNWVVGVVLLFLTIMLSASPATCCRGTRSPTGPSRSARTWPATRRCSTRRSKLHPAGRHRGRPEHAAALLRAPHHGLAARRRHLPGRPLLADPEGRRHLVARCDDR